MAELKIDLSLDPRPFAQGLKSALNMGKSFNEQFKKIASGVQVRIDETAFQKEISNLDNIYNQFKSRKHEIDIKADAGQAKTEARTTKKEIEKVPRKRHTKFTADNKDLMSKIASIGLAAGAIGMAIKRTIGVIGEYISASNIQEEADKRLIASLQTKGIYTESYYNTLKEAASAIQKVTVVGDEQSEMLMGLAINMGVAQDKVVDVTKGAIGLAMAFKDAGLSQEMALKGIALAYQGNFTQLQRYIPELRSAATEAEKMAILQKNMADGFKLAQKESQTGSGALTQYSNLVGDLKEKMGDMIKTALMPIVRVMSGIVSFLNDNQTVFKGLIISLGGITAGLMAAKLATIQWNATLIANPIVAIVGGIIALGTAIALAVKRIGGWNKAWEYAKASMTIAWEYMKAFGAGIANFVKLTATILTTPWRILWESVKNVFSNIKTAWKLLLSGDFSGAIDLLKSNISAGMSDALQDVKIQMSGLGEPFQGLSKRSREIWSSVKVEAEATVAPIQQIKVETAKVVELTEEQKSAIEEAKKTWETWANEYKSSKMTEKQKIEIEFKTRLDTLKKAYNESSEEFKNGYQLLLDWKAEKDEQIRQKEKDDEYQKVRDLLALNERYFQAGLIREEEYKSNKMTILQAIYDKAVELYGAESEAALEARAAVLEFERQATEEEKALHEQKIEMYKNAAYAVMDIMRGYANYERMARQQRIAGKQQELQNWVKSEKQKVKQQLESGKITREEYDKRIKYIEKREEKRSEVLRRESHKRSTIEKLTSISQAMIATYEMAVKAYKALAGIPVVGPALAAAASAAAIALGMKNVQMIKSTPAYAKGGLVRGGRKIIQVNEEGEEFVINARATRILGSGLLTRIMTFPQKARETLERVVFPAINIPQPVFAFATGGSTSEVEPVSPGDQYNVFNQQLIIDLDDIKEELKNIKSAVQSLELKAEIDSEKLALAVENGNKLLDIRNL